MPSIPLLGGSAKPAGEQTTGSITPTAAAVVPAAGPAASTGSCQSQVEAEARAKRLVVLVRAEFPVSRDAHFGSGVVIAARNRSLYVVTARHVVHKDRAGKPAIKVALSDNDRPGVPATVLATRFPARGAYADLAVLQVDGAALPPDLASGLAIVRDSRDGTPVKEALVIGNPADRGKTVSPLASALMPVPDVLQVTSTIEPGYSGGGAFDRSWRLIGIVFNDSSSFAQAYPIDPVLSLLRQMDIAVDLAPAPAAKKGIHLTQVSGEPPDLNASVSRNVRDLLQRDGFEPGCDSPDAHKLTVSVRVRAGSLTTSVAEIQSVVSRPGGGELARLRQEIHYTSFNSANSIEAKVKPMAQELVQKVAVAAK